ncbi:MAG: DUF411 domain-containing protein [Gemmatimonadota bacterium]
MFRRFPALLVAVLLLTGATTLTAWHRGPAPLEIRVVKSPTCGCCTAWVSYMEKAGFKVTVENRPEFTALKRANGVTRELESCHTAFINGYVIEGHVPADLVKKLVAEHPAGVKGLSAPGMPASSPGMDMGKEPYTIYSFDAQGHAKKYATR